MWPAGRHNCDELGTAAPHGRPRPVAPAQEGAHSDLRAAHAPLCISGCTAASPVDAGPRPGASRTTLWNPAASGTRPGPESPRPAAVPPEPCRPAACPASPAPVAPRPELTWVPGAGGPRPHLWARLPPPPPPGPPTRPPPTFGFPGTAGAAAWESPKAPPSRPRPATPRPAPRPLGLGWALRRRRRSGHRRPLRGPRVRRETDAA